MNGFSTADGFVEITEDLADMIKYVANEPSVGLFYVQQHAQNAVPNLIGLNNLVIEKSRGTTLHTEDLDDSLIMVRSMKECGLPIANEMIKDIKNSLAVMSTRQPQRGLIHDLTSGLKASRSSLEPVAQAHDAVQNLPDIEKAGSYFSTVFTSAKQRASMFKWPQFDSKLSAVEKDETSTSANLALAVAVDAAASALPDTVADEMPLSSHSADELQEVPVDGSATNHKLFSESENYDVFRADKEAKLKEWLEDTGNLEG